MQRLTYFFLWLQRRTTNDERRTTNDERRTANVVVSQLKVRLWRAVECMHSMLPQKPCFYSSMVYAVAVTLFEK